MPADGKVANAEEQLQATLSVIPAYTWYADPSGALTFVNERLSDYLGLPKDHPLRSGIATGASWDSHISLLHPDDQEESRRVWSTCLRTGCAGELRFTPLSSAILRCRSQTAQYQITGCMSTQGTSSSPHSLQ